MNAHDLWKKLLSAADELVKLDIVTAVGPLKWQEEDEKTGQKGKYVPEGGTPTKVMHTRLDLLQGDIVTQMDEEFATGKFQALRDYHAEREKQGHKIIADNIQTLKSLLELLMNLEKNKPEPPKTTP